MADFVGYAYAVVVFLGGLIGYVKAGSVASLASGAAFGVAAAYGAKLVSTNPKNVTLALAVSVALLLVMGFRFSKSGKFMPAGLVSLLR
ncbi:transmembrane protein 14C-like protein [Jimgerdemannia flammicorona]|uniref:Transmembrane protein 14C-like protein n=1 Tax=Jimgerdemannia flammicorona TaxID=994334 RepID=A0A433QJV6_9FUNG|nr:transmembrane protein 14C-like protein [Jimgerdemannia flammicorona]